MKRGYIVVAVVWEDSHQVPGILGLLPPSLVTVAVVVVVAIVVLIARRCHPTH